jgi:hypothetical protein
MRTEEVTGPAEHHSAVTVFSRQIRQTTTLAEEFSALKARTFYLFTFLFLVVRFVLSSPD